MKVKVNVNNLELNINVRKIGKGSTSILMVHGIPTNARLWRHVQELLGDRYTCYAMDMVGYGESDMP
ncbi:MAG: alpha/beta fold hydrolase, partial [Candidatus Oxydemutatoraceae bacterium WSBS_2016_MAG_OTU14]